MSEPSFLEKLAMMKVEEEYPNGTKEFDELRDKEKADTITSSEKKRLDFLDKALIREYERCRLHYSINWSLMRDDVKTDYRAKVSSWWEKGKTSSNNGGVGSDE